ncbi:Proteasome subunit beta type-6 [Porphyridium purpureum]|uniref:proteasome endopeptidase complex n=1 Tax=Porphyridium purpureum TaxID=35688 RepID=A0A5J4Z3G2_PORPP|nr:Proteasome subunit beta type-6 [Porphyridium purpureum]|eukprot:POR7454..scf295_1
MLGVLYFHQQGNAAEKLAMDGGIGQGKKGEKGECCESLVGVKMSAELMELASMDWTNTEHMMGTTIMATAFDGGVVMGADSRTTTGSYIANRVSDKITPITDKVWCCRSGSAADTQAISDYVRLYTAQHAIELGQEPRVKTVANLFREICYSNKANLMAGIICAGWDQFSGGQVYNITLGGSCVQQPFSIGGSGSTYIYGYCDSNFRENMTRDECVEFVKHALALAMARDGSSGGVIRMVIIDSSGVQKVFIPGDKLPMAWQG